MVVQQEVGCPAIVGDVSVALAAADGAAVTTAAATATAATAGTATALTDPSDHSLRHASIQTGGLPADLTSGTAQTHASPPFPAASNTGATKREKDKSQLNVLVVDDSPANRKMLSRILRMNHLCEAPVEAVNGEDAVERVMCTLSLSSAAAAASSVSASSANAANGSFLRSSFGGEEIPMSAISHPSNDQNDAFINRQVRTYAHGEGSPPSTVTGEAGSSFNNSKPIGFTSAASTITNSPLPRFIDTFDAILMDSVMPIMTGPEATARIRALGYTGLILGVTGNALPEDIEHFTKCGANAVLTKPVNTDLLVKLLNDLQ